MTITQTIYKQLIYNKGLFSFDKEVLEFDASLFMASFDIKSLLTYTPLTEILKLCVKPLQKSNKC